MTRYQAEKAIRALVPGAWVKQWKMGDQFGAEAFSGGGAKHWTSGRRASQAEAWDTLVQVVEVSCRSVTS